MLVDGRHGERRAMGWVGQRRAAWRASRHAERVGARHVCSMRRRPGAGREERRRREKKKRGKRKREKEEEKKRKRGRKKKRGTGEIHGDGREPVVASMRSDAHKKRGV